MEELQEKLANLVFSYGKRLKPFADLLQAAYDAGRTAERARMITAARQAVAGVEYAASEHESGFAADDCIERMLAALEG